MKRIESLDRNFLNMEEEFNSCNNRTKRNVENIFESEINYLINSLEYFNEEYNVLDKEELERNKDKLKEDINNIKNEYILKYQKRFLKEVPLLKLAMSDYFNKKINKNEKFKMCKEIKKYLDELCDFEIIDFDEVIKDYIYDFKVNFEMNYIRDEYSKDDFNKINRGFIHGIIDKIRCEIASTTIDMQDIVSRYASNAYEIVDAYRETILKKISK